MPILESQVDRNSDEYKRNREKMLAAIAEFREAEASVQATSEKSRARFAKRKQLMPRERIALLLDRGAPFLELMPLAGYRMHDDRDGSSAGGGSVAGIGYVEGVRCVVSASNSAIKGGTVAPSGQRKGQRVQQVVMENKLPLVHLVESGGANLLYQAEIFVPGGRGFANQARMSARGIPQVTVVHGSSTAGGAYLPGLSDYVIMVRNQAKVFLAGPPLLKAATGEIATDEELGGAEMHATVSGVAEWMAENDADGIRMAREVIARWHWNDKLPSQPQRSFKEPLYDIDELCGVVPPSYKDPYDVREVIARLVDGSDFLEFKGLYDQQMICGWAEIEGEPVAFIGNNGPITTKGAVKAAQFIQLCCQQGTPIVYLQNTTGYMVGTEAERGGIVKHGSKMIQAVANATVPQITVVIGGSFGAGNYGMCGRAYDPRFIFAWPNNRTAVMGGEQAAGVMKTVTEQKFLREGKEPPRAEIDKMFKGIVEQFDRESTALYGTAHLWDDGIIDPRDTRRILAFTLSIARESIVRPLNPITFGVARM
ncbi:MAG TPA: carboxyl transferase domain-containing protein [Reyranella sp.]|nr:carboxyl transferase domain-containing protein [Reyranella sp.]